MGKKRKAVEISEEDKIQAIIVRDPYGWKDPSSWDGHDRQREDDGLYPFVEWMEYILCGMGAPGSLAKQRGHGPAVLNVWSWSGRSGRNELVVSVRKDIDVSPILGEHIHSRFLKHRSQQSQARKSIIRRASYATEDEIENRGEGWRPNDVPTIPLASVRRNFMEPYPLPIQHHDQNKQDTKGSVKQEMKPEIGIKPDPGSRPAMKQEGESTLPTEPTIRTSIKPEPLDVKPIVKQETNAASSSVIFNSESQTHLYGQEPIDIKPKISDSPQASSSTPNSTSTTRPAVTVKKEVKEEDRQGVIPDELFARVQARKAAELKARTQASNGPSSHMGQRPDLTQADPSTDTQRPIKRVKREEV